MKTLLGFAFVAALSLALSPAAAIATAEDSEEGFVKIFNGKDLDGWVYGRRGSEENKAGKGYQVDGGVLYCTKGDGGNLFTAQEYGDFALRLEFKLVSNANNGIAIRAPLEGDAAYAGMEIQVLDDGGSEYKSLKPTQYHGSIYDLFPAERGHQKPVGEWNSQEIRAKGRQVTIKLNGHTIVDANLDDLKDPDVLKRHPGLARTKGHIGFLGHGYRVEFRNIRIKEL